MINQIKIYYFIILSFFTFSQAFSQIKNGTLSFNADWRFYKGDTVNGQNPQINTASWRKVNLPHDWSIEGPFSEKWASATGYLPGGIGWYQKTFTVPQGWKSKNVYIYFGGVYKNSTVWVNGNCVGNRPNGFISFQYDLSKYLKYNSKNTITVKVDHHEFADSRWYTGSGIYRNVYLIIKDPLQIKNWGVEFTTPKVSLAQANVNLKVNLINKKAVKTIATVQYSLLDNDGKLVVTGNKVVRLSAGDSVTANFDFFVQSPQLWSVDKPNLYKLIVNIISKDKIIDKWTNKVGIRSIRFDADKGFYLNEKNMKIKGVCIHDDAGALGVAVPEGVWRRRLETLKEAGCNSLRMSHNPHADYLYNLCDEMGFLVMEEAFDEWEIGKNKWVKGWNVGTPSKDGYHKYFKKWAAPDLRDMILRGFNHPSIIMWSIGNEIDYPNDPYSSEVLNTGNNPQIYGRGFLSGNPPVSNLSELSKTLVQLVKKYDITRPVTAALAGVVMSNTTTYPENLDIVGYNYQEYRYQEDHKKFPKRIIYGSENGMQQNAWNIVDSNQYISAQYLWTGIDYLGEAGHWPERSSRAGLLDLAGFRKPEYYFRQSLWTDKPMIYIGASPIPREVDKNTWSHKIAEPNWNWQTGDKIRINCFTNCAEAELFLNSKSLGRKLKSANQIIYWDIDYQPGQLKVVGYNQNQEKANYVLKTSGKAYATKAVLETGSVNRSPRLAHLVVQVIDKDGTPVYNADNEISFSITGKAKFMGLESGSSSSHEDYKSNKRKSFHGKLLAYIQSEPGSRSVHILITSPGLKSSNITIP